MKLLLCAECLDIVKLIWRERRCICGRSCGMMTEAGVGHFTGPALPLETSELGLKSVVRDAKSPSPVRIVLHTVPSGCVETAREARRLDPWVSGRKRKRKPPKTKRKALPESAKPWAGKRRK